MLRSFCKNIPKTNNLLIENTFVNSETSLINFAELLIPCIKSEEIHNFIKVNSDGIEKLNSEYPKMSQNITAITYSISFCQLCKNNQFSFEFTCNHSLCDECLYTRLIGIECNSSVPILGCPICEQKISENEIKAIFSCEFENKRKILERPFIIQAITDSKILCKKCKKMCRAENFLDYTCMHMCKDCIAENLRYENMNCDYCENEFDNIEYILNEMVVCDYCKNTVYYVGNFVKKLYDGHLLCGPCLINSLNNNICIECHTVLSAKEAKEIALLLFENCTICDKSVLKENIILFACCDKYICNHCFSDTEFCPQCQQNLVNSIE